MSKQIVGSPGAARLPYSPALAWGGLVFVSGQVGADPVSRECPPDIKGQTRTALNNVKTLAEAAGASMDTALRVAIHMTDILGEFQEMNEVFREFFPIDPPSRTTVGIPHLGRRELKIEIEMIAHVTDRPPA